MGSEGATLRNSRGHVNLLTNSSWRTNPTEKNEALSLMEPGKQSPFWAVGSREGTHSLALGSTHWLCSGAVLAEVSLTRLGLGSSCSRY